MWDFFWYIRIYSMCCECDNVFKMFIYKYVCDLVLSVNSILHYRAYTGVSTNCFEWEIIHKTPCQKKKEKKNHNVNILARDDRWPFERGVKESIYVNLERPSLKRGGGPRQYLSTTYNTVQSSLPRQLNNHSHLGSPSLRNQHVSGSGQWPESGLKLRAHTWP